MARKANPAVPTSQFNELFDEIDLSVREIAETLDVRTDTVTHWRAGRRDVPPGVLQELQEWLDNA